MKLDNPDKFYLFITTDVNIATKVLFLFKSICPFTSNGKIDLEVGIINCVCFSETEKFEQEHTVNCSVYFDSKTMEQNCYIFTLKKSDYNTKFSNTENPVCGHYVKIYSQILNGSFYYYGTNKLEFLMLLFQQFEGKGNKKSGLEELLNSNFLQPNNFSAEFDKQISETHKCYTDRNLKLMKEKEGFLNILSNPYTPPKSKTKSRRKVAPMESDNSKVIPMESNTSKVIPMEIDTVSSLL